LAALPPAGRFFEKTRPKKILEKTRKINDNWVLGWLSWAEARLNRFPATAVARLLDFVPID
jgi:hypothetical protein